MTDATPGATQAPRDCGLTLVVPGRRVAVGEGWLWVTEGWKLFTRSPLMWIVAFPLALVLFMVVGFVPVVGFIASPILQTLLWAGFMVGARNVETEGEFEIEHLFVGFSRCFAPLAIVGLLLLAASLVVMGVVVLVIMGLIFAIFGGFDLATFWENPLVAVGLIALGVLLYLALLLPVMAAFWFAPPLVAFHGMKPMQALRESFGACLRNFIPFIVYGLVMLAALIPALIPFGLGLLVWVPLTITSTYVAYRRIFTEPESASVGPAA